jgi:hypothetical protein
MPRREFIAAIGGVAHGQRWGGRNSASACSASAHNQGHLEQ